MPPRDQPGKTTKNSYLDIFILGCVFLIPLVWSKYLNANYVSAKFFLFYFISSFSLIASSRQLTWPTLPKPLLFCFGVLGLMHLLSPVILADFAGGLYMFKFLGYAFLAYYFYVLDIDIEAFVRKFDFLILAAASLILIFALNDLYSMLIVKGDTSSGFLLGSFGNVNMLAEFLVLSLPLVFLWYKAETSTPSFFKMALLFGWLFFILYCRSRSAWISLGLWAAWGIFSKKIQRKEVFLFIGAFVVYQLIFFGLQQTILELSKDRSAVQREQLYLSTLKLIQDHPFGIGVGMYFNEIVPYLVQTEFKPQEFVFFDQPHSEILKWAAQFGWLAFVLMAVVFFYTARALYRRKDFFLIGSLLVLMPEIFFQFPFENPASLAYIAFLLALTLRLFPVARSERLNLRKRIGFFVLALVGVIHSFAFVTSIFLETSYRNNANLVVGACDYYPVNVNACFLKNQYLLSKGRLNQARESMAVDLERFPFHSGLLRLLPGCLKNSAADQKTCESVLMYNSIFDAQTYFLPQTVQACAAFKVPVVFYTPEQFKHDYLKWSKNLLR